MSLQGDSGGPLGLKEQGSYFVVGVVSYGRGCGGQPLYKYGEPYTKYYDPKTHQYTDIYYPSIYSNIAAYYDWIVGEMSEYSEESS